MITVAGAYVATTADLRALIDYAVDKGYEHTAEEVFLRLDPGGKHIVTHQITTEEEKASGIPAIQRDLAMNYPAPCHVLVKVVGRKKPVEAMINIPIFALIELEPVDERDRPLVPIDGQHR